MSYITTYCRIKNNSYSVNGEAFNSENQTDFSSFAGNLYKQLNIKYPKFHKMDLLAKTAFLGSEVLVSNSKALELFEDDEIALFFGNSESSAYSDIKFQESCDIDAPSPSQFVYTLPNILLGEIAIRNKWYGENLFLVLPEFDAKEFCEHINLLLQNDSKAVLCGWVNVTKTEIDAFFFVVENKSEAGQELSVEKLLTLYNG